MANKSDVHKFRNVDTNPCIEEGDNSQRCLDAYNYDKSKCSGYFTIYKNCRRYWQNVMLQRKRNGVTPEMPSAEERQKIIAALGGKPY